MTIICLIGMLVCGVITYISIDKLGKERQKLIRQLRATNEAWREYERKTVALFELRGQTAELKRLGCEINTLLRETKTEEANSKYKLVFEFILANLLDGYKAHSRQLKISTPDLNDWQKLIQWLCDRETEITKQIQAIYDEHNKTGLLQRKER